MIGYIYHIKNKETNKEYIGQTTDIKARISKHFNALEKNSHHSHKLQRSYNKHGADKFEVTYREIECDSIQDLFNEEMKEISKFDTYVNGYNETIGGEGHLTTFDFETMILIYQIGQRYDGVKHKLANYCNCDRTTISSVFKRDYLKMMSYDDDELNSLISKIGLTEANLKGNYVDNYSRKLTEEDVLKILSVIEIKKYSQAACAKVFHVKKDVIGCIVRGRTYKEDYSKFMALSKEQKEAYAEDLCNSTDIIRIHYQSKRGPVKNPLTQEQVNYILDNEKTEMTNTQIAKNLGISIDRVASVLKRKSYLDMIWVYERMK